jgi:hypothetical protein
VTDATSLWLKRPTNASWVERMHRSKGGFGDIKNAVKNYVVEFTSEQAPLKHRKSDNALRPVSPSKGDKQIPDVHSQCNCY